MAYTRRVVSFDRQGRKRVVFRSMGDGPVTDPSQVDPNAEIQMPDDYVGSGFDPSAGSSETVATVGPIRTSLPPAPASPGVQSSLPPPPGEPMVNTNQGAVAASSIAPPPNTLLIAAALAGGAWYLFGRKKRKKG